ncbi:intermembrane phospholipid transport protein YdbH family protein [Methylomonas koyamae]|uniref:intermembrane phospholipid transport protein YdbH family protein n=1 Tax=Methylomonas koyamae TaxID=702114 RepID=UPI002873CF55|nr:YdbH domain-containing protein [Methylomonas koyamae]WNB75077.1 YdbH domain-containing protein [Methylomonas koyamae]
MNPVPDSPTTRKSGKRYRRLLVPALLIIVVATVWSQRYPLGERLLLHALQFSPLAEPELSGLSFDGKQVQLERFGFRLETAAGPLQVTLQNVAAGYRLEPLSVEAIDIGHAVLKLDYQTADTATNAAADESTGRLPLPPLRVANLDLQIATPWGDSRFNGRAQFGPSPQTAYQLILEDGRHSLTLNAAADAADFGLALAGANGARILALDGSGLGGPDAKLNLRGKLGDIAAWLQSTPLLPATLRPTGAPAALAAQLGNSRLNLELHSADGFAHSQAKLSLTRDKNVLAEAKAAISLPPQPAADIAGRLALSAGEAFDLAKPWLPETARSWSVASGEIAAAWQLHWQTQLKRGTAKLDIGDLSLTAGPARLQHSDIHLAIPELADGTAELSARIRTLELGEGLTGRDLELDAAYREPELALKRARLAIFGGQLELVPDKFDISQMPLALTLKAQQIDLAQLLASLHYPQLSGTGSVDGELPLKLATGSIELQDGALRGTRPGTLRYQSPADDGNLAFQALRNLVYHRLQAQLNYQPSGDYRIGLRLEGHNPEVLSGHPLAFNLNISGQLPELLRRGLVTGNFERAILEQVGQQPAETPPAQPAGKP